MNPNPKYIAFFTVVPLMIIASSISVLCPICGGSGSLSSTPGMANVQMVSSDFKEVLISRNVCSSYIVYEYMISLTIKNNGAEATTGWIKAVLKEYNKEKVLDTQYLPVEIPGLSTIESKYDIAFRAGLDQPLMAEVETEIESGNFADKICNGSGEISLNSWLLAKALEKSYREISRVEHVYVPLPYLPPDIEDIETFWMPPPDSASTDPTTPPRDTGSGGD